MGEQASDIGFHATVVGYSGTYAPRDIAFKFGMWTGTEFKIDEHKQLNSSLVRGKYPDDDVLQDGDESRGQFKEVRCIASTTLQGKRDQLQHKLCFYDSLGVNLISSERTTEGSPW